MKHLHDRLESWLQVIPLWLLNMILGAGAALFLAALLIPDRVFKVFAGLVLFL